MEEAFLDLYIEARERPPKRVILEFDATDDGVRPSASLRGDRPLSEADHLANRPRARQGDRLLTRNRDRSGLHRLVEVYSALQLDIRPLDIAWSLPRVRLLQRERIDLLDLQLVARLLLRILAAALSRALRIREAIARSQSRQTQGQNANNCSVLSNVYIPRPRACDRPPV